METTNKQINEKASYWYAVYATAGVENKVKSQFDQAGFETYQPLQPVARVWNNRMREVMAPVIPGFIFVCLFEGEIAKASAMKGVSFLLKAEGEYVFLSSEQLESLRAIEKNGEFVEFVFEQHEGVLRIEGLGTVRVKVDN